MQHGTRSTKYYGACLLCVRLPVVLDNPTGKQLVNSRDPPPAAAAPTHTITHPSQPPALAMWLQVSNQHLDEPQCCNLRYTNTHTDKAVESLCAL